MTGATMARKRKPQTLRCRNPACRRPMRSDRRRGLCWHCYDDPMVRAQFPSIYKRGHPYAENDEFYGPPRPPDRPTVAQPGSLHKLFVLIERARRQMGLWHPEDGQRTEVVIADHLSLPDRITWLRKRRQWSQEELARQAGLALGEIRRYESGQRRPGAPALRNLAWAFDVPLELLTPERRSS